MGGPGEREDKEMTEAISSFEAWLTFAVGSSETEPGGEEGGYYDDPSGGPTWRGIELSEWRDHRCDQTLTGGDMRDLLRRSEIGDIAEAGYWTPMRCSDMPKGVDVMMQDHGFNAGRFGAAILLQKILGVTADGRIGPLTLLALRGADEPKEIILQLQKSMETDYRDKREFAQDGDDWLGRLGRRTSLAIKLAAAASIDPIGALETTGQS
jgi:lysozyme family protein